MFTPNELEAIPLALECQFKELESRIMLDIVRRVKNTGEITRAADWQLYRLSEIGKSKKEVKQYIQNALKLSDNEIDIIYATAIESGYARDEQLYKNIGKDFIGFADNKPLQQLIYGISEQTKAELKNITQSMGFAVRQASGKLQFTPIADYYQKALDGAVMDITNGAFDYNTVLKRIVREMTDSGLRTVDYASGWSNRVDVAARRAVMTGVNQVTAKINEDNARLLNTDMFETTWHSGSRPAHQVWQGRWFDMQGLKDICGYGKVDGLKGANCRHDFFAVIPGVSEPTYTAEQLEEMNRKENIPIEYKGKQYTKYEALQKQRRLETTMRAQRQKIKLLEEGGADEDDITTARARYRVTSSEYTRFSEAMKLPQQRERVTVDGLGNIGDRKYVKPVENSSESGIINTGRDDMGLSIEIDKFTPCLVEANTGRIVNTAYGVAENCELQNLQKQGWNFDWTADDLKKSTVYKLTLENENTMQGLVAVTDYPKDKALYINIAESAPHNIGHAKQYEGVGGHLFAIAANESLKKGYGGFLFLDAKNPELVRYYREKFGATLLGMPHPYRMFIDEDSARKLLDTYTLRGE